MIPQAPSGNLPSFAGHGYRTLAFFNPPILISNQDSSAIAIDEYVPIRMPITSARLNPRSTSPPNVRKKRASTVRKVRPAVKMVLLRV